MRWSYKTFERVQESWRYIDEGIEQTAAGGPRNHRLIGFIRMCRFVGYAWRSAWPVALRQLKSVASSPPRAGGVTRARVNVIPQSTSSALSRIPVATTATTTMLCSLHNEEMSSSLYIHIYYIHADIYVFIYMYMCRWEREWGGTREKSNRTFIHFISNRICIIFFLFAHTRCNFFFFSLFLSIYHLTMIDI